MFDFGFVGVVRETCFHDASTYALHLSLRCPKLCRTSEICSMADAGNVSSCLRSGPGHKYPDVFTTSEARSDLLHDVTEEH